MDEPRWLDEVEERVWRTYVDVQRDLRSELSRRMEQDSRISGPDFQILVPLSESPDGRMRARDLGLHAGWERSRLSHHLRRMEGRGLVAREECLEDARGLMVRLTPEGRQAVEAAAPPHVEAVRHYFFDLFSREEMETLGELLTRIGARLGEDRTGPCEQDDSGACPSEA